MLGTTTLLVISLIKQSWLGAVGFSWEPMTISQLPATRLNRSTVCFDQASLRKHLDRASDKRRLEIRLAACPAAAEEFEWGGAEGGQKGRDFQWSERCSQKISQI